MFFLPGTSPRTTLQCHSVIGLGPRDARFHTINWKNAHYFQNKCANFASFISRMVNKYKFRIKTAKIAHIIMQKCAFFHIKIFSDIITECRFVHSFSGLLMTFCTDRTSYFIFDLGPGGTGYFWMVHTGNLALARGQRSVEIVLTEGPRRPTHLDTGRVGPVGPWDRERGTGHSGHPQINNRFLSTGRVG